VVSGLKNELQLSLRRELQALDFAATDTQAAAPGDIRPWRARPQSKYECLD
jgi:hypothetical protein